MITADINGLNLLKFEALAGEKGLRHAVSSRRGGRSPAPYASLNLGFGTGDSPENPPENLRRFCAALDVPFRRAVRMRQEHTANVRVIGPDFRFPEEPPGVVGSADAVITGLKDTPLLAVSADCALTVLYDPRRSVAAVVHSGWRGAVLNIYARVAAVMRLRFGCATGDIIAGVSPMISVENYPVGDEVAGKLNAFYPPDVVGKCLISGVGQRRFSLKELLKHQLISLGVERYEFAHLCTYSEKDLFYSRRRDGAETGRFGLLVSLA